MSRCSVCESAVSAVFNLGTMPLGNGFVDPRNAQQEFSFELVLGRCRECGMVQLLNTVERSRMFHESYAFYSSTSKRMLAHFARFAEDVRHWLGDRSEPFVVEIGSNDGILLDCFRTWGIRHLGVEPSANVAAVARERGNATLVEFFDADVGARIAREHGLASAVVAANVMCHLPYVGSVMKGIRELLDEHGVFVFEDPYLGDIVNKNAVDQIYDEHALYFSVRTVRDMVARYDMQLVDAIPQAVHGGSMRYVVAARPGKPTSARLDALLRSEEESSIDSEQSLIDFGRRALANAARLRELVAGLRGEGKRVVGYGATAKSATILKLAGIGPDLLEYICDTTPIKHGKLSPGMHIPVVPHEVFTASYPDYVLLLAWNHFEEISAKEVAFRNAGGRWIRYVPNVEVI
jgi:methylation protein EvaC